MIATKTSLYKLFIVLLLGIVACNSDKIEQNQPLTEQETSAEVALQHAQNFTIQKQGTHTILTIKSAWKNAQEQFKYVLYPKTEEKPTAYQNAVLVATPIERVICTSTTQIAMLNFLGLTSKIVGLANADYVYNPAIQARIEAGEIKKIGNDNNIDYEQILALKPDVVFTFSIGDNRSYQKIKELGIPAIMVSEFMETSPLGRLEWVQFFAHFFDETAEAKAATKLAKTWQEYEQLQSLLKEQEATTQPTVFTGAAYEGTWHVAGGKSFIAQFMADAGGQYLWADKEETAALPLDVEAVYAKAKDANLWLNVLAANNKTQLLEQNDKYGGFKAFQDGQIYSYTKRISSNGGYDFFESAIVHPERVLKDLIKIFYPDLLVNYELYYYQKLEN